MATIGIIIMALLLWSLICTIAILFGSEPFEDEKGNVLHAVSKKGFSHFMDLCSPIYYLVKEYSDDEYWYW